MSLDSSSLRGWLHHRFEDKKYMCVECLEDPIIHILVWMDDVFNARGNEFEIR